MALKYQFNKISLQTLGKQLKIRINALPTLKNKESALRAEVQKFKRQLKDTQNILESQMLEVKDMLPLYCEFPEDILTIKDIDISIKKIAGVKIPSLNKVNYDFKITSLFKNPAWFLDGAEKIKHITSTKIKLAIQQKRIEILEHARRKTTQKVNLYEKVQIPAFEEAILKIKRFLEDMENLDKAGQKIVKKRIQLAQGMV